MIYTHRMVNRFTKEKDKNVKKKMINCKLIIKMTPSKIVWNGNDAKMVNSEKLRVKSKSRGRCKADTGRFWYF